MEARGERPIFSSTISLSGISLWSSTQTIKRNILGYANTSIPTGNHTLGIRVSRGMVYYDYAIVNPGDVISSSSAAGVSTGPSASTGSPAPSNSQRKKVAVGAIVGGCVRGIAVVLAFLTGLLLCRRA
ncbi:hypothetical protein C8R43DRAFT_1230263 [Mycena crocata]|nr:hypothetical protein C8R43DRAFT_1230263 [Mycena crocata]